MRRVALMAALILPFAGAAAAPTPALQPLDDDARYYINLQVDATVKPAKQAPDKAEQARLAKWPRIVRRVGPNLFLRMANGQEVPLTSKGRCETDDLCAIYKFDAYAEAADRLLVDASFGEQSNTLLIDRRTAKVASLQSETHVSPDGKLILSLGGLSDDVFGSAVELDALTPDGAVRKLWNALDGLSTEGSEFDYFEFVAWRGPSQIEFMRRKPGKEFAKYGKPARVLLDGSDGRWRLKTGGR